MNAKKDNAPEHSSAEKLPAGLRVGGAFVSIALILLLLGIKSIVMDGWMALYAVTPQTLALIAAAALVGAFITTSKRTKGSLTQVIALSGAVLLIAGSRLLGTNALWLIAQYWLFMYAGAAVLCALVIRRALMEKS